jgi:CHAT domain-containing protein
MADEFSYKYFWKAISDKLNSVGAKKVYLSPDGVYHIINLNTIPVPGKRGKYVQDEIELFYISNLKDLTDAGSRKNLQKALLIGHPDYNFENNKIKGSGERSITIDENSKSLRNAQFTDLPGTDSEVKKISTALEDKKWEVTSFNEKEATEERVKQSGEVQVLHIATHGFFLPAKGSQSSASMMNSGVVLAGVSAAPDPSRQEDGILTAAEASNLKLDNTDLVVLSACESGLGALASGEGVFGLQRGLRVAGAKGIIMSLWKVNDDATQELMSAFYKEWTKNNDTAKSFRSAQETVRKKYPDPYYWGAFVYIGK